MLSYLRGKKTSKIVLGFVGVIMLAFAFAGVEMRTDFGGFGRGSNDENLVTVGGDELTAGQIRARIDQAVRQSRAQNPAASPADLVASGAFEPLLNNGITELALEAFGRSQGLAAGKRLIDGQIVNQPGFQAGGKFDETSFRMWLGQQGISEDQLRRQLSGDMIRRQLLLPLAYSAGTPKGVAAQYASLLLETREGSIGMVPVTAMRNSTPPTDAELNAYYAKNIAHYTMPERRVLRYAAINAAQVSSKPPSEADIARFYNANAAGYAKIEKRKLAQVVLRDQAQAQAFVAKVKGGTSFAKAAAAAGFNAEDIELGEQTRKAFADLTSAVIADAAFSARQGALTEPAKSSFGWHVVEVQSIDDTPARSLAQVHDEIAASLAKQQTDERLRDLVDKLQDAFENGTTFAEAVGEYHLEAKETPPITADGKDPEQSSYVAPIVVTALLKAGFEATEGDHPSVETLGSGQNFAILSVGQIVPATPKPLAKVRDQVASDFERQRASARAEVVAKGIVAKVEGGTSMARAFADAGLPPPQQAGGRRKDLAASGGKVPPVLAFLFSLPAGATRTLPGANGQGWLVVHVGKVTPGDPNSDPALVASARQQLSSMLGEEYAAQFANAAAAAVKVRRDDRAIAKFRAQLAGTASAGQ
jgi:peptidyl-prolyl cis-trans isomerase D